MVKNKTFNKNKNRIKKEFKHRHARNANTSIYFIIAPDVNKIKIGVTSRSAIDRLNDLIPCSPITLRVLKTMKGNYVVEKSLHDRFKEYHSHNEWFYYKGKLKSFINSLI